MAPADILEARGGTLRDTPLPGLLVAILRQERTCALELLLRQLTKRLVFEDGVPVACASNLLPETLGKFLVERGKLTEAQYQAALGESVSTGTQMGELLVQRGLLSAFDLYKQLQANLALKILEAFRWSEAAWRLSADVEPSTSPLRMNERRAAGAHRRLGISALRHRGHQRKASPPATTTPKSATRSCPRSSSTARVIPLRSWALRPLPRPRSCAQPSSPWRWPCGSSAAAPPRHAPRERAAPPPARPSASGPTFWTRAPSSTRRSGGWGTTTPATSNRAPSTGPGGRGPAICWILRGMRGWPQKELSALCREEGVGAEPWGFLAEVQRQRGDFAAAEDAFRRAFKLNPGRRDYAEAIAQLSRTKR